MGDRVDILLSVAPAALDVFDGHVSRHAGGHRADRPVNSLRIVLQRFAGEPKGFEQAVDRDPGGEAIVIPELELGLLSRLRQSLEQADPSGDLGQAAAAVIDSPRNHLEAKGRLRLDHQPEHGRLKERAQCVNIVDQQPSQIRIRAQGLGKDAVAQQVGDLIKVTRRIEALDR